MAMNGSRLRGLKEEDRVSATVLGGFKIYWGSEDHILIKKCFKSKYSFQEKKFKRNTLSYLQNDTKTKRDSPNHAEQLLITGFCPHVQKSRQVEQKWKFEEAINYEQYLIIILIAVF